MLSANPELSKSPGVTMKIIDLIQDTDPWLKWRESGIGASDVLTIIGCNPDKTKFQLWCELVGLIERPDLSKNPHVQRGKRYEPVARRVFETASKDHFEPLCIEHPLYEPLHSSLDGYSQQSNTILEIKCPCESKFQEVLDKKRFSSSYRMYYTQVQYQMLCTDELCSDSVLFFYCTERASNNTMAFRIPANPDYQEWLRKEVLSFWNCVVSGKPPALDPQRDALLPEFVNDARFDKWEELTYELVVTLRERKKYEALAKKYAKEQSAIQEQIIGCFGDFKSGILAGVKVSVSTRKGNVDYKTLLEDLELLHGITVDVNEYRANSSSSIKVSVDKKRGEDLTESYLTEKLNAIVRSKPDNIVCSTINFNS